MECNVSQTVSNGTIYSLSLSFLSASHARAFKMGLLDLQLTVLPASVWELGFDSFTLLNLELPIANVLNSSLSCPISPVLPAPPTQFSLRTQNASVPMVAFGVRKKDNVYSVAVLLSPTQSSKLMVVKISWPATVPLATSGTL